MLDPFLPAFMGTLFTLFLVDYTRWLLRSPWGWLFRTPWVFNAKAGRKLTGTYRCECWLLYGI